MPEDEVIKATGTITKEESLINIEHSIMHNTMVLESSRPFPGYHGDNIPETIIPGSIYLVTEKAYDGEHILRTAKRIKQLLPDRFDASFGYAIIHSQTYHFIRIADLDCFDCIDRIQEAFNAEGIIFMKKKAISGDALISIQKFFKIRKTDDHIYRDINNPLMYYFEIPWKPEWDFFRKITVYIRSNVDNYTYDAALGTFYLEELKEMVRIFGKDITSDQLYFIRSKYLYELAHPDHLG